MDASLATIWLNAAILEELGDTESLSKAALLYRRVLQRHHGIYRHELLFRLASTLSAQFNKSGKLDQLSEAIALHRAALQLRPLGHAERGESLNNLACLITLQSKQIGDPELLAEAIALHRETLSIRPPGHHDRHSSLSNLAGTIRDRFQHTGNSRDIEESVMFYHEALSLQPVGHSDRGVSLNGLAGTLCMRFEQNNDIKDLDKAIVLHREALQLRPTGHPLRSTSMNNLAMTLWRRFEQFSDASALSESIRLLQAAQKLQPHEHPDHSSLTNNLATALLGKSNEIGDLESLASGLSLQREVLRLRPLGHPERYAILHSIARAHLQLSYGFRPIANWTMIVDHILEAITDIHATARNRLRRVRETLHEIEHIDGFDLSGVISEDILRIYNHAIQLLPRVAHFGLDLSTRLQELTGSEELCRLASLRADALGRHADAVELLEEGRGVFWTQALHLRGSSLDFLPCQQKDELRKLFNELQQGSHDPPQQMHQSRADTERKIEQRRKLSARAERLIDTIREQPGFERFLMMQNFQYLRQAAIRGPVVILVDTECKCFALLMRDSQGPIKSISLPMMTSKNLRTFSLHVSEWGVRSRLEEDRKMNKMPSRKKWANQLEIILQDIWTKVVGPIFDVLGLKKAQGRDRPRLHWCPTGNFTFLPLHAAGIYIDGMTDDVSDYVVSSYTPTLSTLIDLRKDTLPMKTEDLTALIVAEPNVSGFSPLPKVIEEAAVVSQVMRSASMAVVDDQAISNSASAILEGLSRVHVLHLACHGQQHTDPLQSQFMLRDGPLSIAELMKRKHTSGLLAFLSACETAKGDSEQPDQAVHLAASILFLGFRSVVATMWRMSDDDGPDVAKWFYQELLKNKVIELDDIPYALDTAVQRLAEDVPLNRWATFIHMGA